MFKILVSIFCLLLACEEPQTDLPPEYDGVPTVEVCSDTLCYSKAVPMIDASDNFPQQLELVREWPENGLTYHDHEYWCEYHGWRIPTASEIETLESNALVDYYHNREELEGCETICEPSAIAEHHSKETWTKTYPDGQEFPMEYHYTGFDVTDCGCIDKFQSSPYVYWARCVKPAA